MYGYRKLMAAAALSLASASHAAADELAEMFFWGDIGNAVGVAAQSYADFVSERQYWRDNIAAAKAELERCGGCASAQAELDKWQGIENRFQEVAGDLALASGMPPIVAQFLGINLPMAPTRSPEQRASECEIFRRDWVGQRPAFCQSKVDAYLNCLRDFQQQNGACTADVATVPGGHCWEAYKYYEPCRNEDYAAVEREKKKEEARAAGSIIPDYARYGTSAIVVYGRVPDDFLPRLPPAETVLAALGAEHTQEVKLRMRKERVGALRQITVKYFHWSDVAPQSRCFESASPTDEIGRRICDDLAEMSFDHHPPLLTCYYVSPRQGLTADAMYWYGIQPPTPIADPTHFLSRSHTHPLTQIGEPRTDCPATVEEAKELDAQYRSTLANLGVEQVPDTVALRSDRERQRQAEHDARVGQIEEARAALADFPLAGTYKFELTGTWGSLAGDCTISQSGRKYSMSCVDEKGGPHSHRASLVGDQFSVSWYFPEHMKGPAIVFYMVDLDYQRAGHGDALVSYYSDSGSVRGGRLLRAGKADRSQNEDAGKPALIKAEKDGAPLEARRTEGTARPAPVTNREMAALERQSVPVLQPSPQAEPTVPPPRDQSTGTNRSSTGSACTVEAVAGTYQSAWGDIVCKPAGNILECCHGKARCLKMLYLELTPDGRNLVGTWEQQNGVKGPAEFGVTENCELTHGHYSNAGNQVRRAWNVARRK